MAESQKPKWHTWLTLIGTILGVVIALNTLAVLILDANSPLGKFSRGVFGMVVSSECDPSKLTSEEFEECMGSGGTEVSQSQ